MTSVVNVVAALQKEFPDATEAECNRFVKACQNSGNLKKSKSDDQLKVEAEKMLENYLDWRSSLGMDRPTEEDSKDGGDDAKMWEGAVRRTMEILASMKASKDASRKLEDEMKQQQQSEKTIEEKKKSGNTGLVNYDIDSHNSEEDKAEAGAATATNENDAIDKDSIITNTNEEITSSSISDNKVQEEDEQQLIVRQIVFCHQKDGTPIVDKKGIKILCVLPAMIDKKLVPAETYGIALSFYFEQMFDRNSEEKVTVLLDVRSGTGWPNTLAFYMINYVRQLAKILQSHLPERLERMIIYPVPRAALGVWAAMKWAFHTSVMDKIVLCPGPAETGSPLPKEYLKDYVDDAILDFTEEQRISRFDLASDAD